jgi:3-oxoacyl-[acyl-carrier protein] reductase
MTSTLAGHTALVTGATRGIGQAIAAELAAAGAFVVGTATSEAGATSISAALGKQGRGVQLDVTQAAQIDAVLALIDTEHGGVSMLVNNAGITRDQLLLRMKDDDWHSILDTNLGSVFRLSKACLRGMLKRRFGRIVSISSVVAATGNPGQSNYAAAKAGIAGFSKSLAREVGSRGITVNVVAPGYIATDMTATLDDKQRELLTAQIAMGRLGEPADIARAVRFLVDPASSFITGETLHVNGGMYMG